MLRDAVSWTCRRWRESNRRGHWSRRCGLLDGTMAVVDTSTRTLLTKLTLGDLPFNPLMSPDGSWFTSVMSANHIAVVDTTTNTVTRTIPADSPNGMAFSNDFERLFVSNAPPLGPREGELGRSVAS